MVRDTIPFGDTQGSKDERKRAVSPEGMNHHAGLTTHGETKVDAGLVQCLEQGQDVRGHSNMNPAINGAHSTVGLPKMEEIIQHY